MAYVITNTRGQTVATILTGDENTTATDLTLIGQNYVEFGLAQNENFVYLLENFAAPTPPLHPIQGQLWFDTANSTLKLRLDVNTWSSVADQNYVQAQKISPAFTGVPTAPTAAYGTNTTQLATTAFVTTALANIDLSPYARLDGAAFTGNVFAPTMPLGTVGTQVATTAFARTLFDDTLTSLYVTKVNGEMLGNARAPTLANIFDNTNRIATTGWVQNLYGNVTVSLYAPKVDAVLQGAPTTPTASITTANTQIASTAFVHTLFGNVDLSPYATKVSPILTGIPQAPTANATNNSTQIATTNYVQLQKISPAFTGNPTAPTAAPGNNSTTIATTAYVDASVSTINQTIVSEYAGSIKMWASAVPPAGWALCDGAAVSRTAFAGLFARIGTLYGAGDGTTTFNLPNLTDRFPIGVSAANELASTGGFADAAVISHTHPASTGVSINDPGHLHGFQYPVPSFNPAGPVRSHAIGSAATNLTQTKLATTNVTATATTSVSAPTGAVSPTGRNIPPYLSLYYIIKMADDGSGGGILQAGAGIDITTSGPYSTITNTGVRSLTAGTGITLTGSTGNITISSSGGGSGTADIAGSIKLWGGSTEPTDWMFCDGRALSRSAYPSLFAKIGTTYGAGDGTTTFNLPNITNRFPVGAGGLYANGATGGSADAVVVSHTHTLTDPGHRHSQYAEFFNISSVASGALLDRGTAGVGGNTSIATTGITINSAGESGTNKNLPPYLGLRYIIKINDNGTQRSGEGGGDTSRAGDVKWVAYGSGQFAPGWQEANGAAVSRTQYPTLFARIGTTYGAGDGSTTFNLPDLRGRFAVSQTSGATGANRASVNQGNVGGDANAVVVSHNHSITDPGHNHSTTTVALQIVTGGPSQGTQLSGSNTTGSSTTGITIDSAGQSGTNANMPPYVTMVAIIKMDDDTVNTGGILQAGTGISITTSGAYTTISSTVSQNPVVAGAGIRVQNATGGAIVSANVVDVAPGFGIEVTNTNGTYTVELDPEGIGIGYGQTWQNLTSSRSLGVTYTNSTGRPIQVIISVQITQTNIGLQGVRLTVGGVIVAQNGVQDGQGPPNKDVIPLSAIVPAGNTYSATIYGTGPALITIMNWAELR
jgi:microcystin-dependent protein